MTTPAVSVLMGAFNRERLIGSAIESVLHQRFSDFELIIVDDCSTDGTLDVAREYARQDTRIRVEQNERNLGDYGNRNRAALFARGHFLKYHDSDDILYPHCLEVMVGAMCAEPSAAVAFSQSGSWPGGPCPMLLSPRLAYLREFLGHGVFQCGPGGAILRKDAFDALGGFRDVGVHSDYVFWLELARRFPVLLVSGDLFWYRPHDQQQLRSDRALLDYARLNGDVWRALAHDDCPLTAEERELARRNQVFTVVKQLWRDVKSGRVTRIPYRVRHAGLSAMDWLRYLRPPRRHALAGTP